ncbi:MAG TPA: SatD family protein [Bacteroidales bacterium]|nr:SatD family protein [Bacteroidales bacterium]HRT13207.1 SatD family protein [Bacteroidales bacterium]HXK73637.1 SatD family protein [Bacteroidales bacterium]
MIAVISGDIIASRELENQGIWLNPLQNLLKTWGDSPKDWKLERGDFFQVEVAEVADALKKALQIKALIKKIKALDKQKKASTIDVRLAIGIGEKTYSDNSISTSNGPAFINSGEKLDTLKKENKTLGIKTTWFEFDEDINLYFKLISLFIDKWTISSAELAEIVLNKPTITQNEIGEILNITQSGVSRRWKRANIDEMLEVEKIYRKKIKLYYYDNTHQTYVSPLYRGFSTPAQTVGQ